MKTLLSTTAALLLLTTMPAWACTPEEAEAKRTQLAEEIHKLTQQSPEKAKEMNQQLQEMNLDTASKDLPDKCQLIDQRIKDLNSAASKANG